MGISDRVKRLRDINKGKVVLVLLLTYMASGYITPYVSETTHIEYMYQRDKNFYWGGSARVKMEAALRGLSYEEVRDGEAPMARVLKDSKTGEVLYITIFEGETVYSYYDAGGRQITR